MRITLTVKTSESWLAGTTVSFPFFYHTHASVLARIWITIIHWKGEIVISTVRSKKKESVSIYNDLLSYTVVSSERLLPWLPNMNIYNIYENQWEYKFPMQFLVIRGIVIVRMWIWIDEYDAFLNRGPARIWSSLVIDLRCLSGSVNLRQNNHPGSQAIPCITKKCLIYGQKCRLNMHLIDLLWGFRRTLTFVASERPSGPVRS